VVVGWRPEQTVAVGTTADERGGQDAHQGR
jgi:hypothetical protein